MLKESCSSFPALIKAMVIGRFSTTILFTVGLRQKQFTASRGWERNTSLWRKELWIFAVDFLEGSLMLFSRMAICPNFCCHNPKNFWKHTLHHFLKSRWTVILLDYSLRKICLGHQRNMLSRLNMHQERASCKSGTWCISALLEATFRSASNRQTLELRFVSSQLLICRHVSWQRYLLFLGYEAASFSLHSSFEKLTHLNVWPQANFWHKLWSCVFLSKAFIFCSTRARWII